MHTKPTPLQTKQMAPLNQDYSPKKEPLTPIQEEKRILKVAVLSEPYFPGQKLSVRFNSIVLKHMEMDGAVNKTTRNDNEDFEETKKAIEAEIGIGESPLKG